MKGGEKEVEGKFGEGEREGSESIYMSGCKLEHCLRPQLACDVAEITHPWVGSWSSGSPHNPAGFCENDSIRRSTATA